MNARDLLRQQFQQSNQFVDGTIDDCDEATLNKRVDGATVGSIAAIYAHMAVAQDAMVSMASGGAPVLASSEWQERTGIPRVQPRQDEEWQTLALNIPGVRDYAQAVYKQTDDFLAKASEDDLGREVETPMGKQSVLNFLGGIGIIHVNQHWGEIAALKGVHGLKGLPF